MPLVILIYGGKQYGIAVGRDYNDAKSINRIGQTT
jgi:hypothetical protein